MKLKDTFILRILQSTTFAFQVYQVARYGALLVGAMAMAWLHGKNADIQNFETMVLIGGSCTFFWVGGLLDGFLLLYKKAPAYLNDGILVRTQLLFLFLSIGSAIVSIAAGRIIYPWVPADLVFAFAVYFFLETFTLLLPYALAAQDRPRQLLGYSIFYGLGYMLAIVVPLANGWAFQTILWFLIVWSAIRMNWYILAMRSSVKKSQQGPNTFTQLWRISSPLMLATLLSQSAVYIDSYLVQEFFPRQFIDFRYGAKEFPLVLLLANSMSIVRSGEIAASMGTGKLDAAFMDLRKSTNRLVWTLFPLSIVLMLLSAPLFGFVFHDRFQGAIPVFDLFLLLAIPRLMFPQSVVRGYHKTFAMSISAGVELVLNIALSLLLMQRFGIAGIAAGTVIAFMVEKLILLGYTQFKLGIAWNRYASVPLWLGWSLALLLVWVVKYVVWPF